METHCPSKLTFVVIAILITQNVQLGSACNRFCFQSGKKHQQSSCMQVGIEQNKCATLFLKPHNSDTLINVQSIAKIDAGCVKLWTSRNCVGTSEMVQRGSPHHYDLNKLPIRDHSGKYWAKNIRSVSGCGVCEKHSFVCDQKRCIPRSHVCDGFNHCRDGSDETNCLNLPKTMNSLRKCESID